MNQGVIDSRRQIIQGAIGFFLGRVFIYSINPFAVAYFAATCVEKKGKGLVMACILAGMATGTTGMTLLKYLMLFAIIIFLDFIRKKTVSNTSKNGKVSASPLMTALCAGGVNLTLGIAGSLLSYNTLELLAASVLESIAIIALVNVFQWGVRFLLYENMDKILANEELISLLLIVTLALAGLPRYFDGFFSVAETISYFIVLYVGYRYGASAGAIAGAFGGILGALLGDGMVVIGLYCLLGIGVGLFRHGGKIISALSYFFMGVVLAYVFQEEIMGIVELRGIVSAIIVFLAIPKESLRVIDIDFDKEENPFAKEDVRVLANYKIEDFSSAFRRLARSFSTFQEKEESVSLAQMQYVFDDLSERVCKNCMNCNYCWDKHYEETYHSIRGILQIASEQGLVNMLDVESDFEKRCIRLEDYVERVNENMKKVKLDLSLKNKMAESRKVLGNQMQEVAGILGDFSKELSHVKERSREEKRALVLALRQVGLQVKKISVLEKRGGLLEVQFLGRAKGRNCVTKRDIAAVLEHVTGTRFRGGGETKNVIGNEYETIIFSQDTNYKVLTGTARVAKSGECVSGDNFSFLELGTGELLMVLSDGMGSGQSACSDSANLVEVLEDLLEVGFQKDSAIRMLNSLFVVSFEGSSFTTLDITSINLHTGECEFLKNGAAPTFIKRSDRIETILSNALPVGIDLQAETTTEVAKLEDSDLVVMVTDGILDAFPGEEKEFYIENILSNIQSNNPSEIANKILVQALERSAHLAPDDMSVLVVGIWEK